jgi:oligopeptide/dipeptide ABC transporter ATP-binding protein
MNSNGSIERTTIQTHTTSRVLLEVQDLNVRFSFGAKPIHAVKGLDFCVKAGEIFGLMGESGSGKTVTAYSILRLDQSPGEITGGMIKFEGKNLLSLSEQEMDVLRGRRISIIFQESIPSLNPVFTAGTQISWYYRSQKGLRRQAAWDATLNQLERVGFTAPAQIAARYPHQLSGGEAQRVVIALALVHDPSLLIADEPTSALDLTVQNQILDLLQDLYQDSNRSLLLISHNLLVIERLAQRVAVMYAGQIIEEALTDILLEDPQHPYTQGLLQGRSSGNVEGGRLPTIPGTSPDPRDLPPACRFAPRCKPREVYKLGICTERQPDMIQVEGSHRVRCYLYQSYGNHRAPLAKRAMVDDKEQDLDERP